MIIKNVEYDGGIFATEKECWANHTKKYRKIIKKSEICI